MLNLVSKKGPWCLRDFIVFGGDKSYRLVEIWQYVDKEARKPPH